MLGLWRQFAVGWALIMLTLSLTRAVFLFNNWGYFEAEGAGLWWSMVRGLRFDLSASAPWALAYGLLVALLGNGSRVAMAVALTGAGAMNLLNCIDAEFFRFIARRSTDDLFRFAFLSSDILTIGPGLVMDFWYLLALWLVIMLLMLFLLTRMADAEGGNAKPSLKTKNALSLLAMTAICGVALRGGVQGKPLGMTDAGSADSPKRSVLELNSAFTVMRTWGKPDVPRLRFFGEDELPVSPIVRPGGEHFGRLRGRNVVVIMVESLGSEYVASLNRSGTGYAPVLDSLAGHGLLFTNAFANGHRSIEGIPACVASLPTWMYEPFITSRFTMNRFGSLGGLLAEEGYASVFMHGGANGTMGLDGFARQAGFQRYIGTDEYPDPSHHDGHWGIFDHHFLRFSAEEFSRMRKPFCAAIFTLSSHHPYTVPQELGGQFPHGTLAIHESIGYADWALGQFFTKARETDWYGNTLFVITADHTSLSEHPEFQTKLGSLRIPILLFAPGDTLLRGRDATVMQQADIMPTVLRLLGYGKPFFALGTDALDTAAPHFALAFKFDHYQVLHGDTLLSFDGQRTVGIHHPASDPMLAHNHLGRGLEKTQRTEQLLKAYLQAYSTALSDNRMTAGQWPHPAE